MSTFHETLEAARRWGEEHYSNAHHSRHAAFANSVAYAAYRMSGGYGGPSIREHAANKALNDSPVVWQDRPEEEIYAFVAPFCYGPLTSLHREVWDDKRLRDISFDNDPADMFELSRYHLN